MTATISNPHNPADWDALGDQAEERGERAEHYRCHLTAWVLRLKDERWRGAAGSVHCEMTHRLWNSNQPPPEAFTFALRHLSQELEKALAEDRTRITRMEIGV